MSTPIVPLVAAVWLGGVHLEKELLVGIISLVILAASGILYLRERSTGKISVPPSLYLLLVAIYLATVALGLKVAEIYDRMWYIYKD